MNEKNSHSESIPAPSFVKEHRKFFELSSDPILVISREKQILYMNALTRQVTNFKDESDLQTSGIDVFLNGKESCYIYLETTGKLIVNDWQEVLWEGTKAWFIRLDAAQFDQPGFKDVISDLDAYYKIRFSLEGKVLSVNDAYCKAVQHGRDQIIGQNFLPMIFKDNRLLAEFFEKSGSSGATQVIEQRTQCADHDFIWIRWTIAPIFDQENEITGFQGTGQDITEIKWNEQVQRVLYEIAQATMRENRPEDLYVSIQTSLKTLMPAENMYIALYEEATNLIHFPFFVDQYDPPPPPQPAGNGLTAYTMRSGKPLLISDYTNEEIRVKFGIESSGQASSDWLGAPLKHENRTIGIIALQTYDQDTRYNKRQVKVLEIVSSQIAQSIIRKQQEESLRENEERYRALFETSQNAIFLESTDGLILDANEAATRIYGYTKEELKGLTTYDVVPEEIHEKIPEILRAEQAEQHSNHENYGRRKNGEVFPTSVSTYKIKVHGTDHVVVTIEDLSEKRTAEQQLLLQNTILNSLANAVAITNRKGKIEWVNPAFSQLTGYSAGEILGNNPNILKSGAHDRIFYKNLWQTILSGYVWRGEIINQRKTGEQYYEEMTITPVINKEGEITNFVAIKQDITQRKHRENELEAIAAMTTALRNAITQEEILEAILTKLMDLIEGGGAVISLKNKINEETVIESGVGKWAHLRGEHLPMNAGISGYVISSGDVYVDNDAHNNSLFFYQNERNMVNSIGAVPLYMQEEIIGALVIGTHKPIEDEEIRLLVTISNLVSGVIYRALLHDEIQASYSATIQGWAQALELRDKETRGHSERLKDLTERLACKIGYPADKMEDLINGAYLHDIGKMGIPDDILLYNGPLNEEQWVEMKKHPVYARDMLSNIPYLQKAIEIPYSHHEYYDGSGYPQGLSGEEIPLSARLFSIIDVWDALTHDRPYRPAWQRERVLSYIKERAGTQFDPMIVDAFIEMMNEIHSEETQEAVVLQTPYLDEP